jgi:hypothetical protein
MGCAAGDISCNTAGQNGRINDALSQIINEFFLVTLPITDRVPPMAPPTTAPVMIPAFFILFMILSPPEETH